MFECVIHVVGLRAGHVPCASVDVISYAHLSPHSDCTPGIFANVSMMHVGQLGIRRIFVKKSPSGFMLFTAGFTAEHAMFESMLEHRLLFTRCHASFARVLDEVERSAHEAAHTQPRRVLSQ